MSAALQPSLEEWKPAANPWLITIAVMLGTFMEVLDTSVANVALPHIAGSLSASLDEATWVLTSYLVSNAIVLPMTGWLSQRFGRKRFLMACIGLFTAASFACGLATNLPMLVFARILQGIGGGALQPIAQAILLESFPREKRGSAMAAYVLGIVFAPVIGPTVGGWITDNYSWRWVFYINIPVGLLAWWMVQAVVEDPPYIRNAKPGKMDFMGFGLLTLWIGTFQVVLDKGQEADWFSTPWIVWFTVISAVALIAFLWREFTAESPLVNLRVFANRNFASGAAMVMMIGVVLYGTTALIPLFLQDLMQYPALQSGLTVSPRGLGSIAAIFIVGRFAKKVDPRVLIGAGLLVLAYSSYLLTGINLDVGSITITWPIILNGAAVSALFIPLSVTTMATLKTSELGNATGLYNLLRNLGGSVGISMVTTLLSRRSQVHQAVLVQHVTPYDSPAQGVLHSLMSHLPTQQALGVLYRQVTNQASLLAYVDDFRLMTLLCVLAVPLVFLFKKGHHGPSAELAAH
jgi:DHA2 family multidrug resistance protein